MYINTSLTQPQCMKCHRLWSHQHVRETFGVTFAKRIQYTQKELLYKEQRSLLPHTQHFVNLQLQKDDLKRQKLTIQKQIKALTKEQDALNFSIDRVERAMYMYQNPSSNYTKQVVSTNKYVRMCGHPDCNGFVNDKDGQCELCKAEYCQTCMEEKKEGHVCKQEDIDTIKLLKKDSKNCPNCSAMIFRISGCPDMFCVHCNTAFNWNTLIINKRGNSNPHYYEWLRNNTGNANAVMECGEVIQLTNVTHFSNYKKLTTEAKNLVFECLRSIHHRENNLYGFMKPVSSNRQLMFRDMNMNELFVSASLPTRTKFMKNEINEKQFKTNLMKIHKSIEYNSHIRDIANVLGTYKQDMMRAIRDNTFDIKIFIEEYVNFAKYINGCVTHIHKLFYTYSPKEFIHIPVSCNIYLSKD